MTYISLWSLIRPNWPKLANLSIKRDTAAAFIFFECVHCSQDSFFYESIYSVLWNLEACSVRLRHCSGIAG